MKEVNNFYAKVDMDALTKISSSGRVNMRPVSTLLSNENVSSSLPIPIQEFHVSLPISEPHKIMDTMLFEMNLNPKHIIFYGAVLGVGTFYELDGQDGLWCVITECSQCFREQEEDTWKPIRCSTPNCANNILFRQKLKDRNEYVGT